MHLEFRHSGSLQEFVAGKGRYPSPALSISPAGLSSCEYFLLPRGASLQLGASPDDIGLDARFRLRSSDCLDWADWIQYRLKGSSTTKGFLVQIVLSGRDFSLRNKRLLLPCGFRWFHPDLLGVVLGNA